MAMLAGYGTFFLEAVLPHLSARESALCVARMSVTWDADDLRGHLRRLGVSYDESLLDEIRARGHYFSTREFFGLLGFRCFDDIDFDSSQGVSIIHDLNTPVSEELHGRYDLVFENGTIEHIFDIKTAIGNIAHMVKVGGHVCHGSPLDAYNHGFYNFSINFFNDFYRANGFSDLKFFLVRYSSNWHENQSVLAEPLEYTHEEFYVNPEMNQSDHDKMYISCLAKKVEHVEETRIPIQAAYDTSLDLESRLTAGAR